LSVKCVGLSRACTHTHTHTHVHSQHTHPPTHTHTPARRLAPSRLDALRRRWASALSISLSSIILRTKIDSLSTDFLPYCFDTVAKILRPLFFSVHARAHALASARANTHARQYVCMRADAYACAPTRVRACQRVCMRAMRAFVHSYAHVHSYTQHVHTAPRTCLAAIMRHAHTPCGACARIKARISLCVHTCTHSLSAQGLEFRE
jgi:hypothetical protein